MVKKVIGTVHADGKQMYLEEQVPDAEALASTSDFTLAFSVEGVNVELDLHKLRQLKRLMAIGEQQLQLRHEQALKARNFPLDL